MFQLSLKPINGEEYTKDSTIIRESIPNHIKLVKATCDEDEYPGCHKQQQPSSHDKSEEKSDDNLKNENDANVADVDQLAQYKCSNVKIAIHLINLNHKSDVHKVLITFRHEWHRLRSNCLQG